MARRRRSRPAAWPDGPTPLSPESDRDRSLEQPGYADFVTVETQRRELFVEEFPEGPYGAAPQAGDPARARPRRRSRPRP